MSNATVQFNELIIFFIHDCNFATDVSQCGIVSQTHEMIHVTHKLTILTVPNAKQHCGSRPMHYH